VQKRPNSRVCVLEDECYQKDLGVSRVLATVKYSALYAVFQSRLASNVPILDLPNIT
jgi:hypothetical protein